MKINMRVVGAENVLRNITMWQQIIFRKRIKGAVDETRLKIEDDARRMAPKKTGLLKATIWSKMGDGFNATVGDGVYYGVFQELGTRNHPPQPFLMPAFQANKGMLEKELKEIIK